MPKYILAIDQGTSSSRAAIFSLNGQLIFSHQIEFTQYFPKIGWVEHNPEEIWQSVLLCCREVIAKLENGAAILAIGISNQRETTIIWDRKTGKAIYPAIVWQDRRTSDICHSLSNDINNKLIQKKTGLCLDPYFSATKIGWILDNVENARTRAENGELAFGTVDAFLLWQLTNGKIHATDITNASRTLLFNIHEQKWDEELLKLFNIPAALLPTVKDNATEFGVTNIFDYEIPITGMAGDQQAAAIGQACLQSGMMKATYGTGCFLLLNTGKNSIQSQNKLLSTIAYRLKNKINYALEGSIFVAGAAVQWLRDLHLITKSSEADHLANTLNNNGGVYLVPAFTGLGAPYWDPNARGALLGLTRDTHVAHIARAALEAVCYQTRDLLECLQKDFQEKFLSLRVDGGMVKSDWLLQFLADIIQIPVERSQCIESSAQGAAFLACLGAGIYKSLNEIAELWKTEKTFTPLMPKDQSNSFYEGWKSAVERVL